MKKSNKLRTTILLILIGLFPIVGFGQQSLYFSEILLDKDGDEETWQFIEIRGDANLTIADRTYICVIESDRDGTSQEGQVKWWFDISGLNIGSNGYLVIRHKGSPFAVAPGATVVTGASNTGTTNTDADGFNDLDAGMYEGSSGKGTIEQYSQSFVLINATAEVSRNDDYETEGDGAIDGQPDGDDYATWTILDQISTIDDDGQEVGYGPLVFQYDDTDNADFNDDGLLNDSNVIYEAGATVVKLDFEAQYLARVGSTTGSTPSDWFAGKLDDNDGTFVSIKAESIDAYADMVIGTIGGPNFAVTYSNGSFSPTETAPALDLIVAENLSSTGDMEVFSLTVNSGQTMTINAGHTLTVNGNIGGDGTLIIESGASLITKDGMSFGAVTIKRNTRFADGKYSFVGTPVAQSANITGSNLGSTVYSYDETVPYGSNDGLNRWMDASSDELMPGKGYAQAFKKDLAFSGVPNGGTIVVPNLSHTAIDAKHDEHGWQLLANPYPAAIDVTKFLAKNSTTDGMITNAVYLWDDHGSEGGRGDNGDYLMANSLGTVAGPNGGSFNGYIGSAQGFFVKVSSPRTDATVTFTEDMRVSGSNSDANYFRTVTTEGLSLKLALSTEDGLYNETLIGYRSDALAGVDQLYDAHKLIGNSNLQFYSFIGDDKFGIQGLPIEEGISTELGYNLGADTQLNLSVVEMNGLANGMTFYLVDNYTGKTYDLSQVSEIQFSAVAGKEQNRFRLLYSPQAILGSEVHVNTPVYRVEQGTLVVSFVNDIEVSEYMIYDFSGKIIQHKDRVNQTDKELTIPMASEGVFIVKIMTSEGIFVRKLIF